MKIAKLRIKNFRDEVWKYWRQNGRHNLAWRRTKDSYRVLVSEVMLQQTQVARVSEKYKEFLKAFPTIHKLARAPLGRVLKMWSGMGYNRRAKYLHDSARIIVEKYKGQIPRSREELEKLPGVGAYTAGAVRVFAFNEPDVLIETNIRAALIQHFFTTRQGLAVKVTDSQLCLIARKAAKRQDPRKWHWALMDYGVYIKKLHKNPARKSAHYVRQSKFEGSLRQVRGAILRELQKNKPLIQDLPFKKERVKSALNALVKDGLIVKRKDLWENSD